MKNGKWETSSSTYGDDNTLAKSFTYSGTNITKVVNTSSWTSMGETRSTSTNMSYAYKKGHLVKQTNETGTSGNIVFTYGYDKKGNLKKVTDPRPTSGTYGTTKYTNTYDKKTKMLKKRSEKRGSGAAYATTTYKYKKIKVKNAALAKKIAAQQWSIINNNNNFALDGSPVI